MAKIRVHELAKELNVDSKKVLECLDRHNIEGKKAQSSLEDEQVSMIRNAFNGKKAEENGAAAPEKKVSKGNPSAADGAAAAGNGTSAKTVSSGEVPKKKKKILQVFRPQNATSKEAKNFHGRQKNGQPKRTDRKDARREAESSAPKAPLIKKPRPHPVNRDIDLQNMGRTSIPKYQPPKKTAEPAAAEQKTAEKNVQTRENVAAGSTGMQAGKESPVREHSQVSGQAGAAVRSNRPARPEGEKSGARSFGDHPGQRRPFGDRNRSDRQEQGSRPMRGERNGGSRQGEHGQRSSSGDRPFRNGFGGGAGRSGGFRSGRMMGKDDEGKKFESHSRSSRPERKSSAAAMDMGMKKPSRDVGHNKAKDKNKDNLRENKYAGDRPQNNGRNNRHLIPKALQKPVHKQKEEKKEVITEIKLPEKMTVRELAEKMKMQPSVIVKKLFMEGEMVTVNQEIDYDKAEEIALSYDIIAEPEEKVDVIAELLREEEENEADLVPRPPVVCVMGHVDHGKTSLLDAIRDTHVTDREAGGITQNIGAYGVTINGRKITFLDTPGHEAFTAMRMRGANSTDIAVLVVAADDGVMPQTIEAINHAKAANVEIIVAINKIDKPSANIERVKQELTEYELIPADWGGSTEFVPVSAKTGEGIEDLLETILLTADIMELKANPNRRARGLVLEAKLDKGKGPVANILVQKGTLHVGDYIACGAASGKVRAMMDENSKRVKTAGPSTPVEVLGLNDVPNAGEILVALDSDKEAKNFAATFISENKNKLLEETKSRMSLDDLFSQMKEGNLKELELIVKADVQGSVEALKQSLLKLSNEEVVIKIIHGGVGAINESDISLAAASNAIVIGFNVRPDATAKAMADQEKVDVRLYRVIYQAIDDIEAAMKGMLEPIYEEKVIGHAEVRQLFKASGVGTIAGSYVLDGVIQRDCKVRISREGSQIFEGALVSLKRFKDDVKEVKAGYECGLVFDNFNELQELDQVEAYIMVEVPRK